MIVQFLRFIVFQCFPGAFLRVMHRIQEHAVHHCADEGHITPLHACKHVFHGCGFFKQLIIHHMDPRGKHAWKQHVAVILDESVFMNVDQFLTDGSTELPLQRLLPEIFQHLFCIRVLRCFIPRSLENSVHASLHRRKITQQDVEAFMNNVSDDAVVLQHPRRKITDQRSSRVDVNRVSFRPRSTVGFALCKAFQFHASLRCFLPKRCRHILPQEAEIVFAGEELFIFFQFGLLFRNRSADFCFISHFCFSPSLKTEQDFLTCPVFLLVARSEVRFQA